jgi:tripartite-type tricarboxylate transporter receptor subunit TctC
VPFRGGAPALTELIAGRVQLLFNPMAGAVEYIRTGTLCALAVTTATRSEALPDVPSVGDYLPGYESSVWFGMGAPRNTPADIVAKLNSEINAALADIKIRTRLADWGGAPLALSPDDFGKLIADETAKWAEVAKFANIKPE